MTKILCYELNEVPWRVIDLYVDKRPRSNLARLLADGAAQITTHTTDSGELHPWSTWPTMHRGVNNDSHNIRFINQDLSAAGHAPPIWEILAGAGKSVGICGCLQSYPPSSREGVIFHIPDTFAPGSETIPRLYSHFQRLNLQLTGENRAVARKLGVGDALRGIGLLRSGLSIGSAIELTRHLSREVRTPLHKARRATMQAHVAFDIFFHALKKAQPEYVAFFSNHVAGMMHRYWKYSFPEDFQYALQNNGVDDFHAGSILMAMDIFDKQLGKLTTFALHEGYDLVIASSMGQQAIVRSQYYPELLLDSVRPLADALGFQGDVRMNLAMQPDVALEFGSESDLNNFSALLAELTDTEGGEVLIQRYPPQGRTLNLMLLRGEASARDQALLIRGRRFPLGALGMRLIARDPGTGYHQPRGILIWKGSSQPQVPHRAVFDSRQFAPTVLSSLGVTPPQYMMAPIGGSVESLLQPEVLAGA